MSTLTAINRETWLRAIAIDCHVLSTLVIKVSIFETWTTIQPELCVPAGLVSCCLPLHKVVSENVLLYYLHFYLSRFLFSCLSYLAHSLSVCLSVCPSVCLCTAHHTVVIKNCVPCTGLLGDTRTHAHTHPRARYVVHWFWYTTFGC